MDKEFIISAGTGFVVANWKLIGTATISALVSHPKTRKVGIRGARWAATRIVKPIAMGHATAIGNVAKDATALGARGARAAAKPVGIYAWAVGTGVLAGVAIGTLVSYVGWGKSGADDALDFYSGGVGWNEYWDTIGEGFDAFNRKHGIGPYA